MALQGESPRWCPGEEHHPISEALCLGRRRANYHKCPGCQFNDSERGKPSFVASVVGQRHDPLAALNRKEPAMIEKVFKAYDVRATYPDPLNEDIAWRVGNATAQFLRTSLTGYDRSDAEMNRILLGRDMRKSSPALAQAFIEGVSATSTPVVDIGLIDTSQIYFAANHVRCCGGVMVTASHNPSHYNGFKICGLHGKPIGAESGLREIQRIASAISRHQVRSASPVQRQSLDGAYRAYFLERLKLGRKLRIVVDASNGSAGRWFPILFDGVPQLETVRLNFEHDGEFVHPPNPLVPANLEQLRSAVREHRADFGACFDGDADRCIFVDDQAHIVACDQLTALLAAQYLKENPGAAVVYDLRSSRIVPETIRAGGGKPVRQRVGHVFMKRAMAEHEAVFGGELSGHFYFRDFWYCDSGMLAFVAVANRVAAAQTPLSALLKPLARYAGSGERNFENDDKDGTFQKIAARYADAQIDHLDGVTVNHRDWWFNVRASNTEPLLRLNLEASDARLLEEKLAELTPLLGKPAKEH